METISPAQWLNSVPAIARIAAVVFTMPVVAGKLVPMRVKLAVVVALSVLILPTLATGASLNSSSPFSLGFGMVNEALLGVLMGLSLAVVLAAAQLVGGLIENLCGFSMAAFGAGSGEGGPLARLFWWTTIAVFVAAGGLTAVVDGLLGSFDIIPTGMAAFDESFIDFLVNSIAQAFQFGVSAALPAIAALMVASIVLGMAQRNFPQLGGMQIGLSVKAMIAMVVTSALLLTAPWLINGGFQMTLEQLQAMLEHSPTSLQQTAFETRGNR